MKIQIVLAKYLDWVLLAVLAVLLFFGVYRTFIAEDRTLTELSENIARYEGDVKTGMTSSKVPPMPHRDYVAELRDRFEHTAVISPYRKNPFVPPEEIVYAQPIQLTVGQSKEIKLIGRRLSEVIQGDDKVVGIKITYDPDERDSVIEFTGRDSGDAPVRVRDDVEQSFRFRVVVLRGERMEPPNPPGDVVFASRGPRETRQGVREPPMVLIFFLPNDPLTLTKGIGVTTNADVYRKPADASDSEYQRINKAPLTPATTEQIQGVWQRFQTEEPTQAAPLSLSAGARTGLPTGGLVVPEVVTEIPRARTAPERVVGKPPKGSFVFLDETVDEGESYTYRVVTISARENAAPASCRIPYIPPEPIYVPSFVQFSVKSVAGGRASLVLMRLDPDTQQPVSRDFTVVPGMKIGCKVRMKMAGVDIRGGPVYKDLDFSTDCILVDAVSSYRDIVYRMPLRVDAGRKVVYIARTVLDPQVIYMTPRGFLRMKGKGEMKPGEQPGLAPELLAPPPGMRAPPFEKPPPPERFGPPPGSTYGPRRR